MVSRYEQGQGEVPLSLERMVGWALCCDALSSGHLHEMLELGGYSLPWTRGDMKQFDDLLRSSARCPRPTRWSCADGCCGTFSGPEPLAGQRRVAMRTPHVLPRRHPQATARAAPRACLLDGTTRCASYACARYFRNGRRLRRHGRTAGRDAILLTSGRGMEALIASRLDDEERHRAYSRIVARLISARCTSPSTPRSNTPQHLTISREEREEDARSQSSRSRSSKATSTCAAPALRRRPKLTLAWTPRTAARSTLGGMHLWCDYWYRRFDDVPLVAVPPQSHPRDQAHLRRRSIAATSSRVTER